MIAVDCAYLLAAAVAGPVWYVSRRLRGRPVAPIAERLRGFPVTAGVDVVWVHGVSVGEVLAARGLIESLRRRLPGSKVVISATTTAGHATARKTYPDCEVFYAPLDFTRTVRRALDQIAPRLLILMELELWPNLLSEARRRDIPVIVANARLSERSARGYARLRRLIPGFLGAVSLFCVQSESHARRLERLGIEPERLRVTGNLKADNVMTASSVAADGAEIRASLGLPAGVPVILGASTHDPEEAYLLAAYAALRPQIPELRLVLAPRHVERAGGLAKEFARRGFPAALLSSGEPFGRRVGLVDTLGELPRLLAAADVVFLGGTLVPVGGHNILEPAAAGRCIVCGPHDWTAEPFVGEMLREGGAFAVKNAEELSERLGTLLRDESLRSAAGERARACVDRHRGAAAETAEAVMEFLKVRERPEALPEDVE